MHGGPNSDFSRPHFCDVIAVKSFVFVGVGNKSDWRRRYVAWISFSSIELASLNIAKAAVNYKKLYTFFIFNKKRGNKKPHIVNTS